MVKNYVHRPVGQDELSSLAALAKAEEESFFSRNPHLVKSYRHRLLVVALCQGAALQYLGRGYGVNDFDLHFFYRQNPDKPRLSRTVKRVWATVGSCQSVPVDFVRTVRTSRLHEDQPLDTVKMVRAFLRHPPTDNARHLACKAVIGLAPQELYATVIWPQPSLTSGCKQPQPARL